MTRLLKSTRVAKAVEDVRCVINIIILAMKVIYLYQSFLLGVDSSELVHFFGYAVFLLHWAACIFYFLDSSVCSDSEERSIFVQLDMDYLPYS